MDIVTLNEKQIYGMSVRTTNAQEMNPETARIGKTWQTFDQEVSVDYQGGERVYGVYYDYESDASGEFNVLAGTEKADEALEKVTIRSGKYLVFKGLASAPDDQARVQAVIKTWGEIWDYFNDPDSMYKRAFITDFEHYKNPTEIDIYISIA